VARQPRNNGLIAALVALGLALFVIPVGFERLGSQPVLLEVELLNATSFSLVRQAYPDADLMNGLVLATGTGMAVMAALLSGSGS
jgi:hypothetical protein